MNWRFFGRFLCFLSCFLVLFFSFPFSVFADEATLGDIDLSAEELVALFGGADVSFLVTDKNGNTASGSGSPSFFKLASGPANFSNYYCMTLPFSYTGDIQSFTIIFDLPIEIKGLNYGYITLYPTIISSVNEQTSSILDDFNIDFQLENDSVLASQSIGYDSSLTNIKNFSGCGSLAYSSPLFYSYVDKYNYNAGEAVGSNISGSCLLTYQNFNPLSDNDIETYSVNWNNPATDDFSSKLSFFDGWTLLPFDSSDYESTVDISTIGFSYSSRGQITSDNFVNIGFILKDAYFSCVSLNGRKSIEDYAKEIKQKLDDIYDEMQHQSEQNDDIIGGLGSLSDGLFTESSEQSGLVSSFNSLVSSMQSDIDSYLSDVDVTLSPAQSDSLDSGISFFSGAGHYFSEHIGGSHTPSDVGSALGLFLIPWIDSDFQIFGHPWIIGLLLLVFAFSFVAILIHGRK